MPRVTKPGKWVEPPPTTKPAPSPDSALWAGAKAVCGYCECGFTVLAADPVLICRRIAWDGGPDTEGETRCPECPMLVSFALNV